MPSRHSFRVRSRGYRRLLASGLLAAGFVVSTASHAYSVGADVGVSALTPNFLDGFDSQHDNVGPVTATLHKQEYFSGVFQKFAYDGLGVARADFTSLGTSSRVKLIDYTPLRFDSSQLLQSVAQFDDDITVPGSGAGFFEMTFSLSGSESISGPSPIAGGVFFNANINFLGGVTLNSFPLRILPQGIVTTGLVPVTLGVPFHVVAFLQTTIETVSADPALLGGTYTAEIDYLHTAALTGVQAYDQDRNPLSSFTTLSGSGTNYAAISSVPLPAVLWLVMASMAGLLRCRRASVSHT